MHSGKRRVTRIVSAAAAALFILFSTPCWYTPPVSQAQEPPRKISSLLDIQAKVKSRYLARAGQVQAAEVVLPKLASQPLEEASRHKIFIRFKDYPTPAQISELQALGVKVYADSWIPPVGKHSTGFMYAETPIQRLQELSDRYYIASLHSAEHNSRPLNNLATQAMNVNDVWNLGFTGTGVVVAVLDSGVDLTQLDIPTPVFKKDYSNYPNLDDAVANMSTGHGTHVAGSVLGRGTSSAGNIYKGSAPGAGLVFLKIGNDSDAAASDPAMIGAIRAAVDTYGARVINMSYGGWSTYHDGSGEVAQAVDYAASKGAVFFGSAGNEATLGLHYSGTVNAGSATDFIQVNVWGALNLDTSVAFNLVSYDAGANNNLVVEYYNSSQNQVASVSSSPSESSRGTRSLYSHKSDMAPPGNSIWYLKVRNNSPNPQFFHLYYDDQFNTGSGSVVFPGSDPSYTISDPAEADSAIAVGAYVTRDTWKDYLGTVHYTVTTPGSIASYSSHGPRVDPGAPGKPNIVAPGSVLVSVRDTNIYLLGGSYTARIVSNDPVNNGTPADYYVMEGTSMSSPQAAGVAALLLSKNPNLTPAQVKSYLESTATDKGDAGRDNIYGWGLINALAAANAVPYPPASFTRTLNPAQGVAPCLVTFTDTSTGSPETWSWNFGDGTGSSSQNPTKTYGTAGSYGVSLTVTYAGGLSVTSATQVINIYSIPAAIFNKSLNPSNGAAPVTVSFTDTSTGNISSWSWNFGDGSVSSSQNPTKTYNTVGNYSVSLTVTNPAGSSSASQMVYVYSFPAASFTKSLNPSNGVAPVTVSFTDTSTGNIATWSWDFGDGSVSSSQNPARTYYSAGNYNVSLTATNPIGSSSTSQTVSIYIPPVASFTESATSVVLGTPITFTDTSIGNITGWSWNFGDGTTSSTRNPSKTYSNYGTYLVTLTVTNPAGSSSANATKQVYSMPVAAFYASTTTANAGSAITFTNQSTGNITNYSWSFGDGTTSTSQNPDKTYYSEGIYTVGLTALNPAGGNTLTRTDYISIIALRSETTISQGVSGGYVHLAGQINRFFNIANGNTVILTEGIGAYDAYMSYSAAGVNIKAVAGVVPFDSPAFSLNTLGGTTSTINDSQTGSAPQPPIELFRFYPSLIGSGANAYTITLRFNTVTRVIGGQVPQNVDVSKTFRRGDANNDGVITITDALFIAQYLAALRALGEGTGQVWPVNAATPRNDSPAAGDSISITDALYVAQFLANLRDPSYQLI